MYILVAAQRSFNDLSKAAKRSGTKFVRRIQRQSSFVLPRKKAAVTVQFTQQQPIQRGTTFINYLDLSCTLFTFLLFFSFLPRMDLRLLTSSLSSIFLRKIFNRFLLLLLVKSSSIDNISTGDVELASSGGIERTTTTGYTGTNAQHETLPSKQRRDKMNNKGQQDEEEERGDSCHHLKHSHLSLH